MDTFLQLLRQKTNHVLISPPKKLIAKGGGGEARGRGRGRMEAKFMKLERIWKEIHNNETSQWVIKLSYLGIRNDLIKMFLDPHYTLTILAKPYYKSSKVRWHNKTCWEWSISPVVTVTTDLCQQYCLLSQYFFKRNTPPCKKMFCRDKMVPYSGPTHQSR